MEKLYRVDYGCVSIDDSVDSRDHARPEFFDTPKEVNDFLKQKQLNYARSGYKLWATQIYKHTRDGYKKINEDNQPHIDV